MKSTNVEELLPNYNSGVQDLIARSKELSTSNQEMQNQLKEINDKIYNQQLSAQQKLEIINIEKQIKKGNNKCL